MLNFCCYTLTSLEYSKYSCQKPRPSRSHLITERRTCTKPHDLLFNRRVNTNPCTSLSFGLRELLGISGLEFVSHQPHTYELQGAWARHNSICFVVVPWHSTGITAPRLSTCATPNYVCGPLSTGHLYDLCCCPLSTLSRVLEPCIPIIRDTKTVNTRKQRVQDIAP